ncbi:hypothetical protein H9Q74_006946 [Fusarium xylarioides]|nr:hypothetical protein H9Q71_006776 [Fusarium xylarioides]KAG5822950.1 hypothetical protein H9Q74_006946 [Fusarium xylarioides]
MAKFAYRLGRAFTNGRKSAPIEFHEVENQLYALSTGLESFKEAADKGEIRSETNIDPDNDPITLMLANCNDTLSHLDNLVTEYGSVSTVVDQNAGNEPTLTQNIKQNWQTIQWTTEGGDLATLRRQLILHTNRLSLVLAPVNNTRTARMSTQVSESAEILQKLYQLFLTNSETSDDQIKPVKPGVEAQNSPAVIYFKLKTDDYICSRAALQLFDLSVDQPGDMHSNLFQCHCSQQDTPSTQTHTDHVSALTYTSRFEEQLVDQLALRKAREVLQQGMNTMLPHVSLSADNVRLLHILGHTSTTQFIDSITFLSDKGSLTRDAIASMNLYHCKSLHKRHVADNVVQSSQIAYDDYSKLVFHYRTEEGNSKDISKSIVYVEWDTDVKMLPYKGEEGLPLKIGPVRYASFPSGENEESIFDGQYIVLSFSDNGGMFHELIQILFDN